MPYGTKIGPTHARKGVSGVSQRAASSPGTQPNASA